ncbi:hypothetical protein K456DRAFT_470374 [Colletotrichum gloeosporioides 23]|nr:hypothetical protein K456DRAFT_470374 [Colletotrichum gloeosporioides 23]
MSSYVPRDIVEFSFTFSLCREPLDGDCSYVSSGGRLCSLMSNHSNDAFLHL